MSGARTEIPFSRHRRAIVDYLDSAWRKHTIRGMGDLDVTDIRRAIRKYRRQTGNELSLTAYLLFVYSRAIAENPSVQASRKGSRKLVIFDDVDISTIVERRVGGEVQPTVYIVRQADKKTLAEIQEEITAAQSSQVQSAFAGENLGRVFEGLPKFVRRLVFYIMTRNPSLKKKILGTVGFTSVSMFIIANGWPVIITPHTLSIALGGLGRKPGVVGKSIEPREMLAVTVSMDHDVIDGAPAARFLHQLNQMYQKCYGLEDYQQTHRKDI